MNVGNTIWMIPGGQIPLESTGKEPEFTSRDVLYLLNTNSQEANVNITIYYTNRAPAGPYDVTVKGNSVRNLRFNDLVNPEPIFLDTEYAVFVQSDLPVVVQFTRMDTRQAALAGVTSIAFPVDA
ncbi:sensory rhodopsin transducer [Longitalea luteola]|uniref:sensory rhodopsin transducer n=1 Tax=Longitalea luteola TaxID=2812563 RepID=UPI001A965F2F|nr:sensory rhodopsin transducer [Longitalea luteola]